MSSNMIMQFLTQNDLKLIKDLIGEPTITDRMVQKFLRTRLSSSYEALARKVHHTILKR